MREGDFLLFTPLPFAEDAYASSFRPLQTARVGPGIEKSNEPTNERTNARTDAGAAADALVDALGGNGSTVAVPNPPLARTDALLHARAADASAAPLAEAAKGGPAAAAALDAPPRADAEPPPAPGQDPDRTARAAAAARRRSRRRAGGWAPRLPSRAWRGRVARGRSLAAPGRKATSGRKAGDPGRDLVGGPASGPVRARPGTRRTLARRDDGGRRPSAPAGSLLRFPEPPRVATDVDGWVPVAAAVKEEPRDTMQMDTLRMDTLPVDSEDAAGVSGAARRRAAAAAADQAEEDGFFDDME